MDMNITVTNVLIHAQHVQTMFHAQVAHRITLDQSVSTTVQIVEVKYAMITQVCVRIHVPRISISEMIGKKRDVLIVQTVVPNVLRLQSVLSVWQVNGELHVKVTAQLIVTIKNVLNIMGTARKVDVLMVFMVVCVLRNAYLPVNHVVITTVAIHV